MSRAFTFTNVSMNHVEYYDCNENTAGIALS